MNSPKELIKKYTFEFSALELAKLVAERSIEKKISDSQGYISIRVSSKDSMLSILSTLCEILKNKQEVLDDRSTAA